MACRRKEITGKREEKCLKREKEKPFRIKDREKKKYEIFSCEGERKKVKGK